MTHNKIAVVTHVNPFSFGSGQVQRVYNTLLAFAVNWDSITIYTFNKSITSNEKVEFLLKTNKNIEIIYVKTPIYLKYLAPLFRILFYFGFGKPSNWEIPILFKNIQKDIIKKEFQKIIFEYWHLYKLASKVKTNENLVICDTHDILTNAYVESLNTISWMPNFYKKFLLYRYKRLEFEIALPKFDMLIAINKEEELFFKERFKNKKIYFCPMGVKLPKLEINIQEKFKEKQTFKILYYGGLGNKKNVNDALKVFNIVKMINSKYNNSINYKVIGSNPPKLFVDILNADANVEVTGFVEDLSTAFKDVDLAVIPFSGTYGFRSRLIELMYYGVPILTTNDSVWGMGFQHNQNIFIYESEEDLPNNLISLLNDYSLREKIAMNAKIKVDKEFAFETTYVKFSQNLMSIKLQ